MKVRFTALLNRQYRPLCAAKGLTTYNLLLTTLMGIPAHFAA
jgi:hypothetical protein